MKLSAADSVEFEKSGVGRVKFVGGSGDLCWKTDGVEKLIGECRMNAVKAFTSVVREPGMGGAKNTGGFNADVLG